MRDGVRAGVPPDAAETWEDGGRWKGEGEGGLREELRVLTPCRMSDFIIVFYFLSCWSVG